MMRVTVHGHFYQPPRENPWTDAIPFQASAAPAHDWNERISDECYRPNARSRVFGAGNHIEEIVNNYAFMNFDFGPTLLSWLVAHSPDVYRQILEGDRLSQRLQQGHGNAIAQVYNHVIMPLANYRDKRTQVVWGLRDFEWRFGRKSESIWLAETAVNLATVKVLIEHGLRYIILSPFQALRWRPLDRGAGWSDARNGKIDPRRPYRFFLKDARRRRIPDAYIDVFFYDGPLAADVSFGHLLRSAPGFADRLVQAAGEQPPEGSFVSVATDGEIYGHHEPFGDMCFSYLVRREARARDFTFFNYGHYLDVHPPQHEIDINFGEQDEGTAWSCAHGVGRWERDCGCSTGGQPGWNQKWRTPLRRGFDMLRDRLVEIYLEQVIPLVRDPWAARDDYILVLLDPSRGARASFLDQHARRELTAVERVRLWTLLESQRHALYMYTSCGWFFADVSGIETVQNMAYACRALELVQPWQTIDLEKLLLEYLAEAASNVPGMEHGAEVYRRFVHPQRVSAQVVAGDLALAAAVQGREPAPSQFRFAAATHHFGRREATGEGDNGVVAYDGLLEITDRHTEQRHRFAVHVYHSHLGGIRCYVLPLQHDGEAPPPAPGAAPREAEIAEQPGVLRLGLADLVTENRERIIRTAYESILDQEEHALAELFSESRDLMATFHGAGVPLPPVLRAVAEHVLAGVLETQAERLEAAFLRDLQGDRPAEDPEVERLLAEIAESLGFARGNEVCVDTEPLSQAFGVVLQRFLDGLLREPESALAERFVQVIRRAFDLHFPLDRRPLEDVAFLVLRKHHEVLMTYAHQSSEEGSCAWRAFEELADTLNLNIRWILEMGEGVDTAAGQRP